MIVSGSASRVTIGHRSALISAITTATSSGGVEATACSTPASSDRVEDHERERLDRQQDHRANSGAESHPRPSSRGIAARPGDRSGHCIASFRSWPMSRLRPVARAPSADRIVFLGHATVLIEVDGVRLLTDPLLRAPRRAPAPALRAGRPERTPPTRRRGADLASAPRPPRPRLAAAARSTTRR